MSYIQKYPFSQLLTAVIRKKSDNIENQRTKGVINMHILYISTCTGCVCIYIYTYHICVGFICIRVYIYPHAMLKKVM